MNELLLLLLVASPFLAWWLISRVRKSSASVLTKNSLTAIIVIAVIAYAIADELIGKWQFDALCEREAGTEILRKIEGVDGFLYGGHASDWVGKEGYRFVETLSIGQSYRYATGADGNLEKIPIGKSQSLYSYKLVNVNVSDHVLKQQRVITVIKTGEILAQRTSFYYTGGWVQRAVAPIGGGTGYGCPKDDFVVTKFVKSVLIPKE